MNIILINARENGSRPPLQSWSGRTPPEGYAIVPADFDTSAFTEFRGFVDITVEGDTLTAMTGNQEALDAYLADHPDTPEPEPQDDVWTALDTAYSQGYTEGVNAV